MTASALAFARLWNYEGDAGTPAHPPPAWPAQSQVAAPSTLPRLIMILHPKCPCSRASVEELSKLMTRCQGKLTASVLMIRPNGVPDGWEETDLWRSAAAIPGVTVTVDMGTDEAKRFGAATSGQTFLYSPTGELLFAGGITESRGHIGDNAGSASIIALLSTEASRHNNPAKTPVYGCPLFGDATSCQKDGIVKCIKQ